MDKPSEPILQTHLDSYTDFPLDRIEPVSGLVDERITQCTQTTDKTTRQ